MELGRQGDTAAVTVSNGTAIVAIHSTSGIGRARITAPDGRWPRGLIVRIDVQMLEGFTVTDSRIFVESSLKAPASAPYWEGAPTNPPTEPKGKIEMPMRKHAAGIDVIIPASMLENAPPRLDITWVDWYRG